MPSARGAPGGGSEINRFAQLPAGQDDGVPYTEPINLVLGKPDHGLGAQRTRGGNHLRYGIVYT